jgi:hypothetical protein
MLLVNVDGFEFEEALAIADGTGSHFEGEKDLGVGSEWGGYYQRVNQEGGRGDSGGLLG